MAMTPLSGEGWRGQGYGPSPSVVLMQNPTAAPYPEGKKSVCPTSALHAVCGHIRLCGRVSCPTPGIPHLLPVSH